MLPHFESTAGDPSILSPQSNSPGILPDIPAQNPFSFAIKGEFLEAIKVANKPMTTPTCLTPAHLASVSRALHQSDLGTRLADMSLAGPKSAWHQGPHRKGMWKLLPYRCAEGTGQLLCAAAESQPQPVSLPLNASGVHHVFLGIWSHGNAAWRAKLSGEPCFRYVQSPPSRISLNEVYLTSAELEGRKLIFGPWPAAESAMTGLAWVRIVPVETLPDRTPPECAVHATSDILTWVIRSGAENRADVQSAMEIMRGTDTRSISLDSGLFGDSHRKHWQHGEDAVYPTPGARQARNFLRNNTASGTEIVPLYQQFADDLGLAHDLYLRLQYFKFDEPRTDYTHHDFFEQNPQWRCVFHDGRRTAQLSYAYDEVRGYLLDGLKASLSTNMTGLSLACHRSGPCVLYEAPVTEAYRRETGRDLRQEDETDPAVMRFRAGFFTRFMRQCREVLDAASQKDGVKRSLKAFVMADQMSNLYYGFDIDAWLEEGLVDTLMVYPVYLDFSFSGKAAHAGQRPWEKGYHPDRIKREARYVSARINREACAEAIDWEYFEGLRRRYGIHLLGGFRRIPTSPGELLKEIQTVYRHEVDGLLVWDIWNFLTDCRFRPIGEYLGHRKWLLSLSPDNIPVHSREILLHDVGDIPLDLFGAQMSG